MESAHCGADELLRSREIATLLDKEPAETQVTINIAGMQVSRAVASGEALAVLQKS
ncbi:hypothetical protein ACFY20_30090 [Streptomyces sp. NPDC001312]|uniref:hypothetical protein n=1 Tax=Streptomyces sp. NPDC001312 TaxID=3364561 RepID=UPI0036970085